jgi:XTP/dITP diphosphohydrolase
LASELLVATRSSEKLAEIRAIVSAAARVQLLSLSELAVAPSAAEDEIECHATFLANAIAKARYFAGLTGMATLADDSGIVIAALAGAPGVRSRRFASDRGYVAADVDGKRLDEANNALVLELLAQVPDEDRNAHYVCAAALADPNRVVVTSIGSCGGTLARAPQGSGGFGYDPLFFIPVLGVTLAELSRVEKNLHSHRAKAIRAITPLLRKS